MATEQTAKKAERLGSGLGDGNGLSWPGGYAAVVSAQEPVISAADRPVLRELAQQVAALAAGPEQAVKKDRWLRHNSLEETEPLVFCDPENAWYELIPAADLRCTGSLARVWEFRLRKEIYWAQRIRDDRAVEPLFRVHTVYEQGGWGLDVRLIGADSGGAYTWEAPLDDYAAIERMHFREIRVDRAKTRALVDLARDVLGDVLEVRQEGVWWWSLGMTTDLIFLRGFERVLFDLYDNPAGVHRLMAFLRDENLARLDHLEKNGLLSLNNGGDFVGTGGYGWCGELPAADYAGVARCRDLWGFCESQETVGVSPELFEEFVFAYQLPLLERFGLNIYGCCEPLDRRWEIVRRIPRLRRVTVSPWSDPRAMAGHLGMDYVYCRKVNPAPASTPQIDEEACRAALRETFAATSEQHCPTEVMLRDVVTLSHNPRNAIRWVQLAREEAARYYR